MEVLKQLLLAWQAMACAWAVQCRLYLFHSYDVFESLITGTN